MVELGSVELDEGAETSRRSVAPDEPEVVPHSRADQPERPASMTRETDRARNWIGLGAVLLMVGLVIVAGVWFLGADADGGRPAGQPPTATLPTDAGNLDALADFTEREVLADASGDRPEAAGDSSASAADPAIAPEPIDADPIEDIDPIEVASAEVAPAETASIEVPEPVEPVDVEPAVEVVEIAELAPVSVPPASGGAIVAEPGPVDPAQAGPRVEITTRVEPCRFGSSCLIAGFVMHGFETAPQEFICEFASGSRFTFRATSQTVDHACATGSLGDSITIEIAGVRSTTVVHE